MTQEDKPSTSNTSHVHWKKRWMVYSKDSVIDKLMENLDTLLKYFDACENNKQEIIHNEKMNDYIQSRIKNIHNLVLGLFVHNELSNDHYSIFNHLQNELEGELNKKLDDVDIDERLSLIQSYIDSVFDMEFMDEDDEEEEDDDVNFLLEDEILKNDKIVVPDNASIINLNNECKKRKTTN